MGTLWLVFNDRSVREVGADGMETNYGCGAYILCYERKSEDSRVVDVKRARWASPLCSPCCGGSDERL